MVITWYGQSCFKVQSGDTVLVTDPYHKEIGLTPPRFKADVITVSHAHADHNNIETIPDGAFVIDGPGDYEVKGVSFTGISTFHDAKGGRERGLNTAYLIEMEGIRLVHLGDFGEEEIRPETLDALGEVDILFLPVGGTYTIDGSAAAEVANAIEPKLVIPMHYALPGLKIKLDGVETFLKEMGVKNLAKEEKLAIKKKELGDKESMRVVVLSTA